VGQTLLEIHLVEVQNVEADLTRNRQELDIEDYHCTFGRIVVMLSSSAVDMRDAVLVVN